MLPKVNQILHIQVESIDEEEASKEYKARIADMTETEIVFEIPLHESTGRLKKLFQGDQLTVFFISDGGVKNYFSSTVTGFREDVVRLVKMARPRPEAVTEIQRRTYLRVPAELEIAVQYADGVKSVSLTEDISGGGLSYLAETGTRAEVGTPLQCWLLIHMKSGVIEHIPFTAEVVRVKELETGRRLIMLQYKEIVDRERQKIIRYCFDRQLEIRKK